MSNLEALRTIRTIFLSSALGAFLTNAIDRCAKNGMSIADVRCGDQPLKHLIAPKGSRYTGIDIVQNSSGAVDFVTDIAKIDLADTSRERHDRQSSIPLECVSQPHLQDISTIRQTKHKLDLSILCRCGKSRLLFKSRLRIP